MRNEALPSPSVAQVLGRAGVPAIALVFQHLPVPYPHLFHIIPLPLCPALALALTRPSAASPALARRAPHFQDLSILPRAAPPLLATISLIQTFSLAGVFRLAVCLKLDGAIHSKAMATAPWLSTQLTGLPNLRDLSLQRCSFDTATAAAVWRATVGLPALTSLSLRGSSRAGAGDGQQLWDLWAETSCLYFCGRQSSRAPHQLQRLDVGWCGIPYSAYGALAMLFPALKDLDIAGESLSNATVMLDVGSNNQEEHMRLQLWEAFGGSGAVSKRKHLTCLERLVLDSCTIDAAKVPQHLMSSLCNQRLRELSCYGCATSVFRPFGRSGPLDSLTCAQASGCVQLVSLDLTECCLRMLQVHNFLAALADAPVEMRRLRQLTIFESAPLDRLTPQGEGVQEGLPPLEVRLMESLARMRLDAFTLHHWELTNDEVMQLRLQLLVAVPVLSVGNGQATLDVQRPPREACVKRWSRSLAAFGRHLLDDMAPQDMVHAIVFVHAAVNALRLYIKYRSRPLRFVVGAQYLIPADLGDRVSL
jgi:hypothetical protein